MPPPINHPLPARPTSHVQPSRPQGLPSPSLSLPRPPFFSTPQPASPRPSPSSYLSYPGGSPKLNSREAPAIEEPVTAVRKAIQAEQLKSNCDLLELGQGWKVHWRAWRGPPLLASTSSSAPSTAKIDSASSKYDPLATHPTDSPSLSSKAHDPPPAKRPKPTAFDEMLADLDDGPVASTSALPPLKDKLQSLHQLSFASDPVELARKEVFRLGQDPATGGRLLGLFSHVRVTMSKGDHGKGKGKEKERTEEDDTAARMLWVFSLKRGTHLGEGTEAPSRAQLSALDFPDLTCVGKGHFSHHDLFPTLYPETSTTTSAASSASQHAPYVPPFTSLASNFPSALSLSAELHSDLTPPSSVNGGQAASPPQSRIKAPFEAFLAAASEALLVGLLSDTALSRPSVVTRLDSSIVYLPPVSEPFGLSSRRVISDAVRASFHLSLQRHGILIQSTVDELPYRPFPVAVPPLPNSPLLLAPFGTPAQFVKLYPAGAKCGTTALAMEQDWGGLLEGTGLRLGDEEAWVLGRIAIPSPSTPTDDPASPPPSSSEPLEVMWPASLCILDGTLPQPSRSPDNTPPRTRAPDLAAGAPTSPLIVSDPLVAMSVNDALPPLDIATRRRFASALRRGLASSDHSKVYRDPIACRAERVGSMLEEQAEERERSERAEKEAEAALKAASAAAPPPTPSSMEAARIPLPNVGAPSTASGGAAALAGAPINMRTPISLGGSSTEAPSPADGFGSADKGLMHALGAFGAGVAAPGAAQEPVGGIKNAEMDHLYPSPSEAMAGGSVSSGGVVGDQQMPASDALADHHSFPDFLWGDDFAQGAMGGRSNMPGHGQDFDDGMMMGLTDDDFSFFDDPPALPVSLPMANFSGLQSSGPSPKFIDHFSHLTGTTPFASAASPSSPFGQPSPGLQQHGSPNLLNFGFDHSHNALGLGSTPGPLQIDGCSPFKTPRTPYSPFVEVTEEQETPAGLPASGVSLAGTPATSHLLSARRPGQFDAISFGSSHTLSDDKYDPRKGKFGLPSPDWERDQACIPGETPNAGVARRPLPLATLPWFSTVCDPRVAAAHKLKRRRTLSLVKGLRQGDSGSKTAAGRANPSTRVRERGWVAQDMQSEQGDEESEDEAMELDDVSVLGAAGDEDTLAEHYSSGASVIHYTFGAALLLLRRHLGSLLGDKGRQTEVPPAVTKALQAADVQVEQALILIADQTMYNPDFRALSTSVALLRPPTTSSISSQAIRLVAASLASLNRTCAVEDTVRASTLPLLTTQPSPTILLRAQQSMMELTAAAMAYWKPMNFEPLAGAKDVVAFAVYEDVGGDLTQAVAGWLSSMTKAYEGSRLGKHALGSLGATGSFAGVKDGLAAVPVGSLTSPRSRDELKSLASHIAEGTRSRKHVVIYLLAPPEAYTSTPASPIIFAIQQINRSRIGPPVSWTINPVPLSAVTHERTIIPGDSVIRRLERLAFAVYDQLLIPVSSLPFPVPETFPSANLARPQSIGPALRMFQSPAITMSPTRRNDLEFDLNWPPSSLEVLHRHRLLHVAYASSPAHGQGGLEWIAMSCIDEKGEIWKTLPKLLRIGSGANVEMMRVNTVWNICKMLFDTADVEWRVIISKLTVPSKAELKAWDQKLKEALAVSKRPLHVSVVGVDPRPPVSVVQQRGLQPATGPSSPVHSHAHSEEGEVLSSAAATTARTKPAHLDTQPSVFALTPAEPVALGPDSNIIAPASTYLVHVPRIASLSHTSIEPFMPSTSAISVLGVHFLLSHRSQTASLGITLAQHLQDIRQSFVELATLGLTRWGTSGRMPWHLESVKVVLDLVDETGSA